MTGRNPSSTLISYAQNAEDVVLMRALAGVERGFYVDVGAADPHVDSVTKAFYDRGWNGVNIDPDPERFAALRNHRPRDHNVQAGAGAQRASLTLHRFEGTGWSTFDPSVAAHWTQQGHRAQLMAVDVVPLNELLDQRPPTAIHFLKIDVEGFEREVILGIDLLRHRPWIIVVEATRPGTNELAEGSWEGLLTRAGYVRCLFDGINLFYCAPEHPELLPRLTYPANVLDDYVPARLLHSERKVEQFRLYARMMHDAYLAERHRVRPPSTREPAPPPIDGHPDEGTMPNPSRAAGSTLFVEVNMLRTTDFVTGIERVGLNLIATLKQLEHRLSVRLVFVTFHERSYRVLPIRMRDQGETSCVEFGPPTDAFKLQPGDSWLSSELDYQTSPRLPWYRSLRDRGVAIYFWVHDLFPILRPEWSTPDESLGFSRWFEAISHVADGLICNSAKVADDVRRWHRLFPPTGHRRSGLPRVTFTHLGTDSHRYRLASDRPAPAEDPAACRIPIEQIPDRPTFLTVASVHPRKAQADLLAAFDLLWQQGEDIQLVLTGRIYESASDIGRRILEHPEQGDRLLYLGYRPDAELQALYQRSDALVSASYDEGFGLPAVEAAARGLPVIQRRIPIFEEIAGADAFWFDDGDPAAIAAAIRAFLALPATSRRRVIPPARLSSWQQTTERMLAQMGITLKDTPADDTRPPGSRPDAPAARAGTA